MSRTESNINVDSLAEVLKSTKVSSSGVSFAGKSLKLNTETDATPVIKQINECKDLEFLNLEGNTLGVDASKGIAEALEKHPEFKRALWKDLFTGRMKTEIPKALQFLGNSLVKAGARLTVLDLSDNAFGPIGVEGLASLIKSPSCYALEELRLNNNGLGITGGKLLSSALIDCYNSSKNEGKPLALKVFIAGRNRLENDGAKALAAVFRMIGTLEKVAMPQNSIYHVGISALFEAFICNKNLEILDLNDNSIGEKGAEAISNALPSLQNLKEINFGDCLLKTKGAVWLAKGLKNGHEKLEALMLDFNEIKKRGGLELVSAMSNKSKLKSLTLDGNKFGDEGSEGIKQKLKEIGKLNALGSLDEDESEDSDDQSENSEGESETDNSDSETAEDGERFEDVTCRGSVEDFLNSPSAENFLALGDKREQSILGVAKKNGEIYIDNFISILMKVAALCNNTEAEVSQNALKLTETMYKEIFMWAQKNDMLSCVNNSILINLGLIKSEDKKFKPSWNLTGCLSSLKHIAKLNFVPKSTKDAIKVFMQREIDRNGDNIQIKNDILSVLK